MENELTCRYCLVAVHKGCNYCPACGATLSTKEDWEKAVERASEVLARAASFVLIAEKPHEGLSILAQGLSKSQTLSFLEVARDVVARKLAGGAEGREV